MYRITTNIICDKDKCHETFGGNVGSKSLGRKTNRQARRAGWHAHGDRHICPKHTAKI